MKVELERCPFCGSKAIIQTKENDYIPYFEYYVMCDGCCCRTYGSSSEQEEVEDWNRRYEQK